MSELDQVNAFIARSRTVTAGGELAELIEAFSRDAGFRFFTLFQGGSMQGGSEPIVLTNYPQAWIEPRRVCRRPQLLRGRGYDEQDDEQVFT